MYYEKKNHWENDHISHCNHGNMTSSSLIIRYYFLWSTGWRTASSACVYFIIKILISTSLQDIKHPQCASDQWKLECLTCSRILRALCDPYEPSSSNNVRAVHLYLGHLSRCRNISLPSVWMFQVPCHSCNYGSPITVSQRKLVI